ncbi:L-lactate dehydrogenase complex protein LldG [Sulfuritortus calidifontis]|uniref:L-lactate dehydrogenase complex protein LldG n=1 Tax=Sulfuritortus calidifontis TaxID=1914471 RepID=A0A4R3JV12_9PROT|nr:LUD domain-containing protein [Sulfuritortus calidifontis]TCS71725.1 L-lactate dehydrogenase complex protein LldG [Sulfuritortus calidifontis]
MSGARAAILDRLGRALGHAGAADDVEVTRRLQAHPRGPQPQWAETPRVRFLAKLAKVAATYAELESKSQIVSAVQAYFDAQALPRQLVAAPHPLLNEVVWPQDWQVARRRAQGEDRTGLNVAFCAIAETGSLVLLSGPESPTTLNFLPEDFLCVLPEGRIVPRLEDAWALLREERGAPPRATNIVTGPSRTADVEQTIQLGAHGPRRLHVLLLKTP